MTHRWLHLRLTAPLMAFGGVSIDHVGPTRDFPSASALTGLFANALGWRREETALHQSLQDRMVFGGLIARQGRILTDNQNARVYEEEPGWTTSGAAEVRNKGSSYGNAPLAVQIGNELGRNWLTHRRRRDYLVDHDCRIVLRLTEGQGLTEGRGPDLGTLAAALDRPARPLFIGRKPCLPSGPLFAGWVQAGTVPQALQALGLAGRALWPMEEGADPDVMATDALGQDLADLRNWTSGLHGGSRRVVEGVIP